MYNHYTIISMTSDGQYTQASYATYFPAEIGSIVSIFDEWIAGTRAIPAHFYWQDMACMTSAC